MYKLLILLGFIAVLQFSVLNAEDVGDSSDGDGGDNLETVDREEAVQFLKRLLHPFSTRNEEQKRETIEVYEEKCRRYFFFYR